MLSCTNCRHAAVSRIPQKRKFCEMNQSDCIIINFLDSTTLCLTRYAASLLELNSSGRLNKQNIIFIILCTTFRILIQIDSDKHTNITQNVRIFRSLVPVLNKLPDHQNLSLFDDMLHFWYQSRVSLFVLLGFSVSIKTISFDVKLI